MYLPICLRHHFFLSSVSYKVICVPVFASLGRFIPRYCILFVTVLNWDFFLNISFWSFIVSYRNARDLLILYTVTLYKSLISSSIFLVASLGFSMYSIVSSVNSDSFTTPFPMWIPFLSSLIAVARTYWIMMDILVLFLILEEMLSVFHLWEWC